MTVYPEEEYSEEYSLDAELQVDIPEIDEKRTDSGPEYYANKGFLSD